MLDSESTPGKLIKQQSEMVTLDLDDPLFAGTTAAAALFQFAGKFLQGILVTRETGHHSHYLATAPFGLSPDPDDTITRRPLTTTFAAACRNTPAASGADPAQFG